MSVVSRTQADCPMCVNREQIKEYRKNAIKAEILRRLGYDSPPNITGIENLKSSRVVKSLIHKMERNNADEMMNDQQYYYTQDDQLQPDEITVLPTKTDNPDIEARHWDALYYSMSTRIQHNRETLSEANLMIHLPPAPTSGHTHANVKIYYIGMDKMTGEPTQFRAKEVSYRLKEDRGGLVKIDIVKLVKNWLRNPGENSGIVVKAWSGDQALSVPSLDSELAPYLQLIFNRSRAHHRMRRNADTQCSKDHESKHCCRGELTIDFKDFGFDWIVTPPSFEAYYCHGSCASGEPADNVRAHLLQMHPVKKVRPCCAANKLSGFQMIYINKDKNYEKLNMEDMIADTCGCA